MEIFRHEQESQKAMEATLSNLILAVKAKLAHVPITAKAVEQIDVPEDALEPEIQRTDVFFTREQIGDKEVCVQHGEASCKSCATHVDLVLYAVKLALQRISIRSLVCLSLLDRYELEKRSKEMRLFPVHEPQICVHEDAHE